MFRLPKSVLHFGAAAIALFALILAAPRTVHAIAATLVQITNTSANPVIAQAIGQSSAQMLTLVAQTAGSNETFAAFDSSLNKTIPYVVPAGQHFVVNAVDIDIPGSCSATSELVQLTYGLDKTWNVPTSATTHFVYPSGFVIPSGASPNAIALFNNCFATYWIYGYQTPN
jgi:hypothetical protein